MLRERRHATEQLLGGAGNFLRIHGLLMLLPAHAHGAEQGDERGRRREENAALGGPNDEIVIAFQRGAEEGLGGQEEHDVIQRVWELRRVIPVRQCADGAAQLVRVRGQ